jgi:hypothetical protein
MNQEQVTELLYQALETELGGVELYETAVQCAVNPDLKKEWGEYLEQTANHVQRVRDVLESVGLDPEAETPGRRVVRHLGGALVEAMEMARKSGEPKAAQLVAAECVCLAETKDHLNWELIGQIAKNGDRKDMDMMKDAHKEIEEEEDEHLYHTLGWTRELWMESLGVPAVIPPPEERKDVKTMMQAARAKESSLRKKNRSRSRSTSSSKTGRSSNSRKKSSRRGRRS